MDTRNLLLEKLGTEIINIFDSFNGKSWNEIYQKCTFICFHKEIINQLLKCNFSDELVLKIVKDDNFISNLFSFADNEKPYFQNDSSAVMSLIINYFNSKEED